jgi:hypothetical protein
MGTMSSLGLRFIIGFSCFTLVEDIVRNFVETGNGDFMPGAEGDVAAAAR